MDSRGRERRRLYRFGDLVRVAGIYERAGIPATKGPQRIALSIGERFPPAIVGWHLEERMRIERPALEAVAAAVRAPAPAERPILLDAAAMEYALETVHRGAWNAALRTIEARILANGAAKESAHVLALIEELRIGRTMPATESKEGDPSDG